MACGFFIDNGPTWIKAQEACIALGGRLPVVTTPEENQDIFNLFGVSFYLLDLILYVDL